MLEDRVRLRCEASLSKQPCAAMQLVLVTAMEDRSLVGTEGFASMLPLAATGEGHCYNAHLQARVALANALGGLLSWRKLAAVHSCFARICRPGKASILIDMASCTLGCRTS